MDETLEMIKERGREIEALRATAAILGWDERLQMPGAGSGARSAQLAAVRKVRHEKVSDPQLGELLSSIASESDGAGSEEDSALVRAIRHEHERLSRVPTAFVSEFSENASASAAAWMRARETSDFLEVVEHLKKTLDISRRFAAFFPEAEHVADPLMAENDPGVTVATLRPLFGELRKRLVPMVEDLSKRSADALRPPYAPGGDSKAEVGLVREISAAFGYDFERGRLDLFDMPFTIRFGADDVRLACAHRGGDPEHALFSGMHETGHALYEQGVDRAYDGNLLGKGASEGVHESQARLWENVVGRGRPLWTFVYPKLQQLRPELNEMSLEEFVRHVNRVEPSPIRTRSDELTFILHIALRFDLELDLLEGTLDPADLREAWNERMLQDLGVSPTSDAEGVLQDGHWFASGFVGGFFQSYAIGSLLSAQFYEAACSVQPQIPANMESGQFSALHGWLSENVYRHGARYEAEDLVELATGSPMSVEPFVRYLEEKYAEL